MKHSFLIAILFFFVGCTTDDFQKTADVTPEPADLSAEPQYEPGYVRILLSEELSGKVETTVRNGKRQIDALADNEVVSQIKIRSMQRTFPYAGRFEERTRKAGLHLWYDVEFDVQIPLNEAGKHLSGIRGVRKVEYQPKPAQLWDHRVLEYVTEMATDRARLLAAMPFDDPRLPDQWHYHNDGTLGANYRAGADINLFDAWSYTTGSPDVIVAVVDGGIDYTHEDLAANMWINTAEKNGTSSRDDDGNGYIDDIYGYNFVSNVGKLVPEDHGTHVAGTIAAVSNNGKGVSGIAGGNGQSNSGVRLMSCQVFSGEETGNTAAAIKYAADNGAVICQNSWGYEEPIDMPASIKAAIDYFVDYAGVDASGRQTGPMRGGIVIFAAGNENRTISGPAAYEKVVAVSSIAPDFRRAYYSCFGEAVDLAAPGGDVQSFGNKGTVLSTVVNGYGYMQGTSMACPHVSGVAALVLSRFKRSGYNAGMLRIRLETGATNIDAYNSSYKGKLGKLVNAQVSMAGGSTAPPNSVGTVTGSVQSNVVTLQWKVPADPDDGKALAFNVYYRKTSLSGINAGNLPSDVAFSTFSTGNLNVGDVYEAKIADLDFETTYYFAVDAFDLSGNFSSLSPQITQTTLANNPPVINSLNGTDIIIKAHQTVILQFTGNDPDGHEIHWNWQSTSSGVEFADMGAGKVQITITGSKCTPGTYYVKLVLEDKYGALSEQIIHFEVLSNRSPEWVNPMTDLSIGALNREIVFSVADYILDPDDEPLKYTFVNTAPNVVNINENKGKLYIVSLAYGLAQITVTATDAMGLSVSQQFSVLVRDEHQPIDIYPNPVKDFMYLRTGEDVHALVTIFNSAGVKVFEQETAISPFAPVKIDLSTHSGGVYNVNVKYNGNEIKKQIIKL
jgi:subtilisin family serine protease